MASLTSLTTAMRLMGSLVPRSSVGAALSSTVSATPTRRYAVAGPSKAHHRVVIIGGGTAGVTVAAQLKRTGRFQQHDIAILDPATTHYYQVSRDRMHIVLLIVAYLATPSPGGRW